MKSHILFLSATLLSITLFSCNRETVTEPSTNTTRSVVVNPSITHSRIVPSDYSQPISLDTANKMIGSYLASVNYPYQDTAVRSLSFDADTMRAYLADSRITTLRFVLAHQLSYLNGGSGRFGKNVGMRPGALTIIAVGIDDNGAVVKNTSNGVYEHATPCPNICGIETDAYLH